jgi:hypothetical protein
MRGRSKSSRAGWLRSAGRRTGHIGVRFVAGGSFGCTTVGMDRLRLVGRVLRYKHIQGAAAFAGVVQSNAASAGKLRSFSEEHLAMRGEP